MSIKENMGEANIKTFVNFCLRYMADLDIPKKRFVGDTFTIWSVGSTQERGREGRGGDRRGRKERGGDGKGGRGGEGRRGRGGDGRKGGEGRNEAGECFSQ